MTPNVNNIIVNRRKVVPNIGSVGQDIRGIGIDIISIDTDSRGVGTHDTGIRRYRFCIAVSDVVCRARKSVSG